NQWPGSSLSEQWPRSSCELVGWEWRESVRDSGPVATGARLRAGAGAGPETGSLSRTGQFNPLAVAANDHGQAESKWRGARAFQPRADGGRAVSLPRQDRDLDSIGGQNIYGDTSKLASPS